jgi:hypothetical protein
VSKHFRERRMAVGLLPVLLLLSGCGGPAGPECDSPDARNSVLKIISDNSHNALVDFVARNSAAVVARANNANSEAEKSAVWDEARQGATYRLDDSILLNSRNKARQTVTCTGLLYATVEDATAQKEVEFKVEQTADGNVSVTVTPFQF